MSTPARVHALARSAPSAARPSSRLFTATAPAPAAHRALVFRQPGALNEAIALLPIHGVTLGVGAAMSVILSVDVPRRRSWSAAVLHVVHDQGPEGDIALGVGVSRSPSMRGRHRVWLSLVIEGGAVFNVTIM